MAYVAIFESKKVGGAIIVAANKILGILFWKRIVLKNCEV